MEYSLSMRKIQKATVIKGVYWVEIPEADLRILCGCPADTVKHLMLRGLIVPVEMQEATFESGPNAILLSDVMLQNGYFTNLSEFPVLQMLYRQGMILPGHPGNTGVQPLLIGSSDQISAQMNYIYRGNYGLITREELEAAGASPEMAEEILRMKLAFAFGTIRRTEELLETRVVGEGVVAIRNGVYITRTGPNIFEVSYRDETVTVDLNLGRNDSYWSPYPLGFHNLKREYFAVIHSGQGDGWDVNRPSMSSVLMFQGRVFLIDAGPNLSYCLTALGIGVNEIEGIFQTHSHDDHFAGLTTLIRADHRIRLYATPLVRASVFKKLGALLDIDEKIFTRYFEPQDLAFDKWNNIDGLEVKPSLSPHPVETSIFTFRTFWGGGYLTYGHYADIITLDGLEKLYREPGPTQGISKKYFHQVSTEYLAPCTLKKIDIGGGLIHGRAEDFREDRSERIILAHTAERLTARQKEIGSSAPFGIMDILIPDNSDSTRRIALEFLQAYFPGVPPHQLRVLINNEIVTFPPGTLMLREGEKNNEIYLLLTGIVEMLRSSRESTTLLSSGEIVGEHSGLHSYPSRFTFRSVSFVHAMRIPTQVYLQFARQNRLYMQIERLHDNREFLQSTWLFGEGIAYPTQNSIAMEMHLHHFYTADEEICDLDHSSLFIVQSGRVRRSMPNGSSEVFGPDDFFGADTLFFPERASEAAIAIYTVEPSSLYEIPFFVFENIPIVLWKLFESHGRTISAHGA